MHIETGNPFFIQGVGTQLHVDQSCPPSLPLLVSEELLLLRGKHLQTGERQ